MFIVKKLSYFPLTYIKHMSTELRDPEDINTTATHLSLHGRCDVGKVVKRSFSAEKMKGADSVWGKGQKQEESERAELQKKFQSTFS